MAVLEFIFAILFIYSLIYLFLIDGKKKKKYNHIVNDFPHFIKDFSLEHISFQSKTWCHSCTVCFFWKWPSVGKNAYDTRQCTMYVYLCRKARLLCTSNYYCKWVLILLKACYLYSGILLLLWIKFVMLMRCPLMLRNVKVI